MMEWAQVVLNDCSRVSYESAVWDRKHLGSYSCTSAHEQQYILCLEEVYMHIFILHFIPVAVAQSCPTLCGPMDCSPPGSSVHGIF